MTTFTPAAQAIIDRLCAINYDPPVVDEAKIVSSISQHLTALNQPQRPVEIYRSLVAAWTAALDTALDTAWDAASTAVLDAALDATWTAAWDAAWDAARAVAIVNATTESSQHDYFCSVFIPFVDAMEGGLFAYWVTPTKIIALTQPIMRIVDGHLHGDGKLTVQWSETEKYYFHKGIQC